MGAASFVISMFPHLLVGYLYHRITHYQKLLPLRLRHPQPNTAIRLKPVLSAMLAITMTSKMRANYTRKLTSCRVQLSLKTWSPRPETAPCESLT